MLTVNELFSGIGAQRKALERLKIPYRIVGISEIDKHAVQTYEAVFGKTRNYGDICKVEKLDYADLWTYSFPCFTAETLILTNRGFIEIKDVKAGDKVITHDNTYQTVLYTQKTGYRSVYTIKGMGVRDLSCTENHKFYVREMYRTYPLYKNGKRGKVRHFKEPQWKECDKLTKKDYLGVAINQNSIMPTWEGITFHWTDGRKDRYKNDLSSLLINYSFWWIIGRYVGDGWERKQGGIIICCKKTETSEIVSHIERCNFNYSLVEERTVNKIHIPIKELSLFTSQFGKYAHGKFIPGFMFDMPTDYLKSFLDGYISADGCNKGKYTKVTSVSKKLIYGVAQLIAKVYKTPYSIYKTNRSPFVFIEGRKCKQKDSWVVVYKTEISKQDKAFYEDGFIWFPIKSIENLGKKEDVYDLTVETNHSFTANGIIVHNCTDISVAGNQKGINETTRSGLLYQVKRLLDAAKSDNTLPKYLLLENVKNLVSKAFINDFERWLDYLSELGYNNYWTILNAKDFGVPQNRERVFCLSIRKDIEKDYHFPKGKPLEIRLKDILESEVDEKFYLSQKIVERFKYNNSLDSNVIGSTLGEEQTSYGHKDLVYNPDKIVGALLATDKQSKQIIEFPCIAASRGRNAENPSKNTVGFPTEQRLEINMQGMSNTLTTVQKDNYVVEMKPKLIGGIGEKDFGKQYRQGNRVYDSNSITMAVLASPLGNAGGFSYLYQTGLRIRKLTPLECWRLMGFDDEDFKKAEASGVSNTQLYKQAGNSIVVNVLEGIFRELVSE